MTEQPTEQADSLVQRASGPERRPTDSVLLNRTLRPDANPSQVSRFADDTWDLSPAVHEAHERGPILHWRRINPTFRRAFKEYVYVLLTDLEVPGLVRGSVRRISPKTIYSDLYGLEAFADWLRDRRIQNLDQVAEPHLDAWLEHVRALPVDEASMRIKRPMVLAVQRLAAHRLHLRESDRLPAALLWEGQSVDDLLDAPKRDRSGNLTPRVNERTMEALLQLALVVTEQAGPQVADLLHEHSATPSAHAQVTARVTGPRWKTRVTVAAATALLQDYLDRIAASGGALPGKVDGTVHWSQLCVDSGLRPATLYANHSLRELVEQADLPIGIPSHGTITFDLPGGLVAFPLTKRQDLWTWNRLVHAAAFIVVAYLSGMRPGEVLNLQRGCVERDPRLGLTKIWGRAWKGVTEGGAKVAEGQERPVPWIVTEGVAQVVELLETLTPNPYLFPTTYNNSADRDAKHNSRLGSQMNEDIRDFISWANQNLSSADGSPAIPPDDHLIHAARFRRTLAWHIVRRPRGLVAAAVQYGHLFTNITMGYAGYADAGWMDDLAIERLFAAVDQAREDERLLDEGERVSGPAADVYVSRVRGAARAFEGRTITAVRQANALLETEDLQVFHGDEITCVFNLLTAACAPNTNDVRPTPDLPGCVATCRNIALTDRDIEVKQRERTVNQQDIDDPSTPEPLKERLRGSNMHIDHVIDQHRQTNVTEG